MSVPDDAPTAVTGIDLTLVGARRVLDATIAAADALGLSVCVAVCDRGGNPLATARMDGAPMLSMQIATDKAWSVASFAGLPTDRWWTLIEDEPALVHGITQTPRLVVFGGGAPVLVGGRLAGAVGVSGGSSQQDTDLAATGAGSVAGDPI
jgi:uncharacterized protein GlcG (DUF336 family)